MKIIEYVLLFCSICILLFFLWCYARYPRLDKYLKNNIVNYHNKKNLDIDNFDLIFLSGTTFSENMCKWLGNCVFSHIGLLVKENDIIYILECDIGQSHRKGVRVINFEEKLSKFKGEKIGCIKKLFGKKPSTPEIYKLIESYLEVDFYNGIWKWVFADYIIRNNEKKMFCSEFVSLILQKFNILSLDKQPYWYSPGEYFKNKLKLNDKYFYGENIFFKF